MQYERWAVLGDIHGQIDQFQRAVDYYPDDVGIISVGDILDSPKVSSGIFEAVQLAVDLGDRFRMVKGNHEWHNVAAMLALPDFRKDWINNWGGMNAHNTLRAYGITAAFSNKKANKLARKLKENGHYDLIVDAPLYIEEEEFIVVHAGLLRTVSWEAQRRTLDEANQALLAGIAPYTEIPPQVKSQELARETRKPMQTNLKVVSGHGHSINGHDERVTAGGKRVLLATKIHNHGDLLAWQSWDGDVLAFPKDHAGAYRRGNV